MNDKTLLVYIGTAEDALQDFMEVWKSGKPASPVNRLSFESMAGFISRARDTPAFRHGEG
ncbi:hypothetical protein J9253_02710 [Thiothrix litoralis]|jgi:hypothetical protein|uniref:Uncharacterized protein n=1 Tax=Thiothrix litoralis TaxID=2891210 RepID=A0ABX7WUD3_9GAMM|nr:hypothetical protein [Thiothrix litoralis]QTR46876.1 hypothetical protein J9253_02710 [Thiothrix litoralis]